MTTEHTKLEILRAIKEDVSQPSIAKEVGFSLGKVNFILKALIEKGLVKKENFMASNNRRKYKYLLTQEGMKEKMQLTQKFIARKKDEYEELQRELEIDKEKWGNV
ncbi:Transcriptional regulator, MarR family [hydrothermal vent metagenome]|uniref:Transcriptional regulator, MarR family n=1 Tax=hydrothermal vent metagenome TaxID=652676 RepID=A0A1W1CKS8_9ZZZZ